MDKKLLLALILSVGTIWFFNYYNKSSQPAGAGIPADIRPGQGYKVPSAQDLARPINTEIDFLDKKIIKKEELQDFSTDFVNLSYSNYGATLSNLDFKNHLGKNGTPLRTIHPNGFYQREQSAFLLALEEKTPYFYELVGSNDLEDRVEITYKTEVDGWIIKKRFDFYKRSYKLDLNLEFEPKSKDLQPIRPRLFFPQPFIAEIEGDVISGLSISVDGKSIDKLSVSDLDKAWVTPSLFGVEDKYFVHSLVADNQGFVQRAFFRQLERKVFPILEGPEIKEKSSWNLSFYLGPKILKDLAAVDERLVDTLSFGWLSWICKLLLKLLDWLYSFLNNFGLAIILLAIIIKIPFLPLTISGKKKMEEFQKHQPNINRINMKYKNNLQLRNQEIMRYHKEHNISPLAPVLGCLPLLIQMPIFFALYKILSNYLNLYQAPFWGWIVDLSAKDPYYVLPILTGLTAILQQRTSPINDPKQKVMMVFMPLVMTAIFINLPAGLVLYWFMSNVLMVGEDYLRKAFFK